jgi:hypothetical protein
VLETCCPYNKKKINQTLFFFFSLTTRLYFYFLLLFTTMSFNKTHSQKTLSQSVAPQFDHSHNILRLSVAPHSNNIERTLSLSVALQLHHLHPNLSRSVAPRLNLHAAPFVPQEMRAAKEYNSRTVPQVTSTLNPNAVPFVSRKSTCSVSMNTEGSGLTSSTQKQAIIKGQKRKLGEPKEEDVVFCKARKENEQGEPPRKKHCNISIAQSYPRLCTLI